MCVFKVRRNSSEKLLWGFLVISCFFRVGHLHAAKATLDSILKLALKPDSVGVQKLSYTETAGLEDVRIYRALALPKLDLNISSMQANEYIGKAAFTEGPDSRAFGYRHEIGLTFTTPLYTFGRQDSVYEMASIQSETVKATKRLGRSQYVFAILKAFSDAILHQKQHEVAVWEANYAKRIFLFTQVEQNRGGATQIDFLRATAQRASADANEILAREQMKTSLAMLQVELGIDPSSSFEIDLSKIEKSKFFDQPKRGGDQKASKTPKVSRELEVQRLYLSLLEERENYRKRSYTPSFSFFANSGQQATDFSGQVSPSGEKTFASLWKVDRWNHRVGLRFDWQLFSGLETMAQDFKAVADHAKARLEINQLERRTEIKLASIAGKIDAVNGLLKAAKKSEQAMKQAFEKSEQDFKSGSMSFPALVEVQRDYASAQRQVTQMLTEKIFLVANSRMTRGESIFGE